MNRNAGILAERGRVVLLVVEEAQAGEHGPLVREVEVCLAVDLVPFEGVSDARELVAVQAERSDTGPVGQAPIGIVREDATGPVDAALRDHVVRELSTVRLVPNRRRHRVEDGAGRRGEVPRSHGGVGNLDESSGVRVLGSALVAHEIERFALLDRTADRAAHLVGDEFRLGNVAITKVRIRLDALVVVIPERRSLDFIGAALDL